MSSAGSGRGRGWLNLVKNAELPRPGGLSPPNPGPQSVVPPAEPKVLPDLKIPPEHRELIDRIRQLSVNDDGILFNHKMKHVQKYWAKDCNSKEEVEDSFASLYNACLQDTELASKLVILVACQTFRNLRVHDCSVKGEFLTHLQKDIENSQQLQSGSPLMFRNCVHMLGEFYSKARLASGKPLQFLSMPFITSLDMLLTPASPPDLLLFATQLYLNGAMLKDYEPDASAQLFNKARSVLILNNQLEADAKFWLLFAIDLSNNGFRLSLEILKFYEEHLGAAAMANFQGPHQSLCIETARNRKVFDAYLSNVNVLQISTSTSPTETLSSETHSYNGLEYGEVGPQSNNVPHEALSKSKEKTGRPILGAGARFNKNRSEQENWNNRPDGKGAPPPIKANKGWEHDDRFETDYN